MSESPDRQDFLPGDIVERTGETVVFDDFTLLQGQRYPVADKDERGYLMFDGCEDTSFNPSGFRLISRPSTPRAEIIRRKG